MLKRELDDTKGHDCLLKNFLFGYLITKSMNGNHYQGADKYTVSHRLKVYSDLNDKNYLNIFNDYLLWKMNIYFDVARKTVLIFSKLTYLYFHKSGDRYNKIVHEVIFYVTHFSFKSHYISLFTILMNQESFF